jgi:hypothetical protein
MHRYEDEIKRLMQFSSHKKNIYFHKKYFAKKIEMRHLKTENLAI